MQSVLALQVRCPSLSLQASLSPGVATPTGQDEYLNPAEGGVISWARGVVSMFLPVPVRFRFRGDGEVLGVSDTMYLQDKYAAGTLSLELDMSRDPLSPRIAVTGGPAPTGDAERLVLVKDGACVPSPPRVHSVFEGAAVAHCAWPFSLGRILLCPRAAQLAVRACGAPLEPATTAVGGNAVRAYAAAAVLGEPHTRALALDFQRKLDEAEGIEAAVLCAFAPGLHILRELALGMAGEMLQRARSPCPESACTAARDLLDHHAALCAGRGANSVVAPLAGLCFEARQVHSQRSCSTQCTPCCAARRSRRTC